MFGSTMGVSYFSSWDTIQLQDKIVPELDMIFQHNQLQEQQQQQLPEILTTDMFSFDFIDPPSNPFLQPEEILYPGNTCTNLQPDFFPLEEPDSLSHIPKRQKFTVNDHYNNDCILDFDPNLNFLQSCMPVSEKLPPESSFLTDFWVPELPVALGSKRENDQINVGNLKKPSLSAQSIAARQRRRKIAEKTQELTKLIPGGQRMNTAEMFQTAAKYVKFLQAQVGILQLMARMEDYEEATHEREEPLVLLVSTAIQEKLSSEEMCLVPKRIVEDLATHQPIQTNPKICEDINKLLLTKGCQHEP